MWTSSYRSRSLLQALAQTHDDVRLEALGTRIGQMRALAGNLQDRLNTYESGRESGRAHSGPRQTLKIEVQTLDKQVCVCFACLVFHL